MNEQNAKLIEELNKKLLKEKEEALRKAREVLEALEAEKLAVINSRLGYDPHDIILVNYPEKKKKLESEINELNLEIEKIEKIKSLTPFETVLNILKANIKIYKEEVLIGKKYTPASSRKKQVETIELAIQIEGSVENAKDHFLNTLIDTQFQIIENAKYLKKEAKEGKYPFSSQLGQAVDDFLNEVAVNEEQKYWLSVLRELMIYVKEGGLSSERKTQVEKLRSLISSFIAEPSELNSSELLHQCVKLRTEIKMKESSEAGSRLGGILTGIIEAKAKDNADKKAVIDLLNAVNHDSKGKGTFTERGKKRAAQVEKIRDAVDAYLQNGDMKALLLSLWDCMEQVAEYAEVKTKQGKKVFDSHLWVMLHNFIDAQNKEKNLGLPLDFLHALIVYKKENPKASGSVEEIKKAVKDKINGQNDNAFALQGFIDFRIKLDVNSELYTIVDKYIKADQSQNAESFAQNSEEFKFKAVKLTNIPVVFGENLNPDVKTNIYASVAYNEMMSNTDILDPAKFDEIVQSFKTVIENPAVVVNKLIEKIKGDIERAILSGKNIAQFAPPVKGVLGAVEVNSEAYALLFGFYNKKLAEYLATLTPAEVLDIIKNKEERYSSVLELANLGLQTTQQWIAIEKVLEVLIEKTAEYTLNTLDSMEGVQQLVDMLKVTSLGFERSDEVKEHFERKVFQKVLENAPQFFAGKIEANVQKLLQESKLSEIKGLIGKSIEIGGYTLTKDKIETIIIDFIKTKPVLQKYADILKAFESDFYNWGKKLEAAYKPEIYTGPFGKILDYVKEGKKEGKFDKEFAMLIEEALRSTEHLVLAVGYYQDKNNLEELKSAVERIDGDNYSFAKEILSYYVQEIEFFGRKPGVEKLTEQQEKRFHEYGDFLLAQQKMNTFTNSLAEYVNKGLITVMQSGKFNLSFFNPNEALPGYNFPPAELPVFIKDAAPEAVKILIADIDEKINETIKLNEKIPDTAKLKIYTAFLRPIVDNFADHPEGKKYVDYLNLYDLLIDDEKWNENKNPLEKLGFVGEGAEAEFLTFLDGISESQKTNLQAAFDYRQQKISVEYQHTNEIKQQEENATSKLYSKKSYFSPPVSESPEACRVIGLLAKKLGVKTDQYNIIFRAMDTVRKLTTMEVLAPNTDPYSKKLQTELQNALMIIVANGNEINIKECVSYLKALIHDVKFVGKDVSPRESTNAKEPTHKEALIQIMLGYDKLTSSINFGSKYYDKVKRELKTIKSDDFDKAHKKIQSHKKVNELIPELVKTYAEESLTQKVLHKKLNLWRCAILNGQEDFEHGLIEEEKAIFEPLMKVFKEVEGLFGDALAQTLIALPEDVLISFVSAHREVPALKDANDENKKLLLGKLEQASLTMKLEDASGILSNINFIACEYLGRSLVKFCDEILPTDKLSELDLNRAELVSRISDSYCQIRLYEVLILSSIDKETSDVTRKYIDGNFDKLNRLFELYFKAVFKDKRMERNINDTLKTKDDSKINEHFESVKFLLEKILKTDQGKICEGFCNLVDNLKTQELPENSYGDKLLSIISPLAARGNGGYRPLWCCEDDTNALEPKFYRELKKIDFSTKHEGAIGYVGGGMRV